MIVLRTFGTDSNPSGASAFVGIPCPIGIQDGDIVLVGIARTSTVEVTPPDATWAKLTQTDATLASGLVVFWKIALNEPTNWVFALSASVVAAATVAVYGNCDLSQPVEATSIALTVPGSTSQNVGNITVADADEELCVFAMASAVGTFTPGGSLLTAARKQQTSLTTELQHQMVSAAGPLAVSETFSTSATGASVAVVLRSSVGGLTVDDVRQRLVEGLPIGAEQVYDLTPTGDYRKLFQAWALGFKSMAYDLVDAARAELVPSRTFYKLQDWERVFGLAYSNIARFGTIPQRRAQVLSAWRAAAGQGSSIPVVKAVLGALLGYSPETPVEVIECDREALTELHTYPASLAIPIHTGASTLVHVTDGGKVTTGGARVFLSYASPGPYPVMEVSVRAPDGTIAASSFTPAAGETGRVVYLPGVVGAQIFGDWTLTIGVYLESPLTVTCDLFVEGTQDHVGYPLQSTGGAIFDWGVYADPAHMGENGTPPDLQACRAALQKIAFAHTTANMLQSLEPWPDEDGGAQAAIPDECIPT